MHTEEPTPEGSLNGGQNRRVNQRYSEAYRQELVARFQAADTTRKAFCEEHNVHPTTFSGWLKRAEQAESGFAEVELPVSAEAPIEVDLPGGVRIKVRTSGDLSRTAELIRLVSGMEGRTC